MAAVAVDASTMISLSSTCLMEALTALHRRAGVAFFMPPSVEREAVTGPRRVPRFALNAMRIQQAVQAGALQVRALSARASKRCKALEDAANEAFTARGRPLRILHRGEAEALALTGDLGARVLVVDERTTRLLLEAPRQLGALLARRLQAPVRAQPAAWRRFQRLAPRVSIARSTELVAWAHEEGLLESVLGTGPEALQAALYAVKYKGCAVTMREIQAYAGRGDKKRGREEGAG